MTPRRIAALLMLSSALVLAACTSSKSGSGTTSHGMPTTADALATLMESGVAKATSARFTLDVNLAGQSLTGSGVERLAAGKLVSLDVNEHLPQGAIRVIMVDGKTYAKLPRSLNPNGKPYLPVTTHSGNVVVRTLAGSLDSALSSASLGDTGAFAKAAKSLKLVGPARVAGVSTTHYSIVVDIRKLPDTLPGKAQLLDGGVKTIPLELYVDHSGRPIQVTENFAAQGQTVKTKVVVTAYDKPVTITAPPADQIGS
jgi:hypothetical protein